MKFIHLSDLHLGKRVHEFSMLEDQAYILNKILQIIDRETPDAILLAGDIYDKPIPSIEAVSLLDDFLVRLAQRHLQVFAISGNHDSPERIAFGGRLMEYSGIHLAPVYDGTVSPIPVQDPYGPVNFYLLPFLKPIHVRKAFPDQDIVSYTDALHTAIQAMNIDTSLRNILVTHQFVTGAARCESEERSVGGIDNVDASVFEPFDYVALGHIHSPQQLEKPTVRYCGTPLKYSFSEVRQEKSVTVVELAEKGCVHVHTVPLVPQRDMVELRGTYEEVTRRSFYQNTSYREDYVRVTLTDEEDIPNAMGNLRSIYHRLMDLRYDNARTRASALPTREEEEEPASPLALFEEFYTARNGQPMSQQQREYMTKQIEQIWEVEA